MGVFDIDKLKASNDNRAEVREWCIQAANEFFDTAQELGTRPFARNSKYSYSELTNRRNATKTEWDPLPVTVVEFYVIMLSSRFDNVLLNEDYSTAVALSNGQLYFNGHKSNPREVGAAIADVCGYIKEIAEELFTSALHGKPWDVKYAIEQQRKYNDPKISVDGNNNVVGGRDVTHF